VPINSIICLLNVFLWLIFLILFYAFLLCIQGNFWMEARFFLKILLVYVPIQGFHCDISVYTYIVYCTLVWFIPFIIVSPLPHPFFVCVCVCVCVYVFWRCWGLNSGPQYLLESLHQPLLPFLKWLWEVWMFHIHTCIKSTSVIFTLFHPPHLPTPSNYDPLLKMPWFAFLSFIVLVFVHCLVGSCLGILPVNIIHVTSQAPSTTLRYLSPPTLYCSAVFSAFCCVLLLHRCDLFQYYLFPIIFFYT
jgi:hypothetical protein